MTQFPYRVKGIALILALTSVAILPLAWGQFNGSAQPNTPTFIPITTEHNVPKLAAPAAAKKKALVAPKQNQPICSYADQLSLTPTQNARLRSTRKTFVADNQAAFDSLRIKRYLIKKLGQDPQDVRQSNQLKAEISQELYNLRQKKEATLQATLLPEQYSKLQVLKQECKIHQQQIFAKEQRQKAFKPKRIRETTRKAND